jgi:Rieske Fe-S protein
MPGEDQERFEDYLELEAFIAELQAGHVAHPPQELTPAQARAYRMATLFHAATPGVGEPDPDFAAQLQAHLEQELQSMQHDSRPIALPRKARVSRRLLLTGSATVAASVALGAGIDHIVERKQQTGPDANDTNQEIVVKVASPLDWFPVTTVATLATSAVKFRVESLNGAKLFTGYVVRADSTTSEQGKIIALSAACTHKGCIVDWSATDHKFHCPCHGGTFTQDGGVDTTQTSSWLYLDPLPMLEAREEANGQVSVRMPASG